MLSWLAENWGTIFVGALIAFLIIRLVYSLVKDRKRRKAGGGCSGGCAGCSMCGSCHPSESKKL